LLPKKKVSVFKGVSVSSKKEDPEKSHLLLRKLRREFGHPEQNA
jgi:hypothetical protein